MAKRVGSLDSSGAERVYPRFTGYETLKVGDVVSCRFMGKVGRVVGRRGGGYRVEVEGYECTMRRGDLVRFDEPGTPGT